MKTATTHNIICLEAEWEYSEATDNKFSLNVQPMLTWLEETYDCNIIYRRIRTKSDLKYYLEYFRTHEDEFQKYDIIYIACHGEKKALWIEGKEIPLTTLAKMAKGFFTEKIIHFSCCRTFSNKQESKRFRNLTNAKLVSGYQIPVDAMDSSIADIAYFNDILKQSKDVNVDDYRDKESVFWKKYNSLLTSLKFVVI